MNLQDNMFDTITKDVIVEKKQGYAFYYQQDDITIIKTNGKLSDESSEDITLDTHFRLASVSKQFIAMGIITLVEQQKVNFDTVVFSIYQDLPNYFQKITIKHLLNHTSGIYDYEEIPHLESDPQIRDQDIIPFLKTTTNTYFEPGSMYRYSNTGYILLGLIIEKISNQTIDKYLEEYVFQKASLHDTYVNYQGVTNIPKRAYGHIIKDGQFIVKDQYWCSATIGDGGLYSTIHELNKWITYLEKNEQALLSTMFCPNILPDGTNSEYGLGIRIIQVLNKTIYYHCGDTIGTNTMILFSPDFQLRCIFLTNFGSVDTAIIKENIVKMLIETKS